MTASTEWHLTPKEWIRGSEWSERGTVEREPPAGRVQTVIYTQAPADLGTDLSTSVEIKWQTADLERLNQLEGRYGLPPESL